MASEGPPEAKKQKVDPPTDSSELSDSEIRTDKETQKALEAIDGIQNELDSLNDKASEEIVEVEKKYRKLRKPFLDKRNEIIEQIPNFWVASLLNHPQIAAVVNQKEKECLQYLNKVEVEEFEGIKLGYKLNFSFKKNPYFTNEVLCKEFLLVPMGDPKSKSTAIDWKDGMDLIQLTKSDRLGGVANKRRRPQQRSFFAWFLDNADPSIDSIAEVIKDDMWPNPLQYYLVSEISDSDLDENGMGDSDDDDDELDESVVVVEDDDDDEEEVYEVEDDDDEELDTTGDVEVIEEGEVGAEDLDDDDDDDGDDKHVEEIEDSKDKDAGDNKKRDPADKADEDGVSKGGDASKGDKTEAV